MENVLRGEGERCGPAHVCVCVCDSVVSRQRTAGAVTPSDSYGRSCVRTADSRPAPLPATPLARWPPPGRGLRVCPSPGSRRGCFGSSGCLCAATSLFEPEPQHGSEPWWLGLSPGPPCHRNTADTRRRRRQLTSSHVKNGCSRPRIKTTLAPPF